MFNDAQECYDAIGKALAQSAREKWDRIEVEAALDGARVDVIASCWKDGRTAPVEYLTGVPRLASHIYDLARLISTEEKGVFKKMKFTLSHSGDFHVTTSY